MMLLLAFVAFSGWLVAAWLAVAFIWARQDRNFYAKAWREAMDEWRRCNNNWYALSMRSLHRLDAAARKAIREAHGDA